MLKRVTKVTSLLVIAASIVSMVPAIAADTQNVEAEDGTIYSALSKGGGRFIIDGEINGEAEAIYYRVDDKYTKLDNASPGDTINDIISDKYLKMNDGDYYIDLTTGEKTDEDIDQNLKDDRATALRKKIKNDNDGRFKESEYTGNVVPALALIGGATTTWSEYAYDLETANLIGNTTSEIYADPDGKYIDADYNLGNIRVYTTTGSSVTIKNTEDTYEIKENGTTYELKAQIKSASIYCENPNDFYRQAELSIWRKVKGEDDSHYVNITDSVEFGPSSNHHTVPFSDQGSNYGDYVTVMQNISKDQASDDIDGIKYAKNVSTYFVTDEDGNVEPILGLGTSGKSGIPIMLGNAEGLQSTLIDTSNKKMYAETVSFKTSNGYNYVDIGDYEDTNFDVWGIGSGQLFCIDGVDVKKWNNNNSFDKLYKVGGGMSNISVNDPGDIIVWDEDNEEYSIISIPPKASSEANTAATNTGTTATTSAGWVKNIDETWSYVKTDGTKATGWFQDGATWYYLNASGTMQTGWINDNGIWYYCNASGAMLANATVDGYVLGANGAWIK